MNPEVATIITVGIAVVGAMGGMFAWFTQQIRSEFSEFKQTVDRQFHSVNQRLDRVDDRFDSVDARFDGVDGRISGVAEDVA